MIDSENKTIRTYQDFFDNLPIPLLHLDLSAIVEDHNRILETRRQDPVKQIDPKTLHVMMSKVRFVEANKAALTLYEASDKRALERNMGTIIPEEALSALWNATRLLLDPSSPEVSTLETWNRTLTGQRLEVRLHILPIKERPDAPLRHVRIAVDDLTSLHRMDEQIRLLSTLPEANPDMVLILGCNAKPVYLNPRARAWIKEHQADGEQAIFKLLPPDFEQNECGFCDRQSERQYTTELGEHHYRVKIRPFSGEDRCMVTIADVTDLTHLKEDRDIFAVAMQSSLTPLLITDHRGNILHINRAFEKLYGYSIDEIQGKNPRILNPGRRVYYDLGYSDEAYNTLFSSLWKQVLDPDLARWEGDLINKTKDGRLLYVHMTIAGFKCEQGLISHCIAMSIDITEQKKNEQIARLELYRTIAALAEMRDNETGHHMLRVGAYARILANAIGMNAKFATDIETFAPLHDIGKVGIPDEILRAPRKLSDAEFAIMRNHTMLGHQILAGKKDLEMADEICWAHHERWDGRGYPRGLRGEEIPLSARITAIADVYDALRSKRPYKPAWTHQETVAELFSAKGTQFDPQLISAFMDNESAFDGVYSNPQYEDSLVE